MSEPTSTDPNFFMNTVFPIASLAISIGVGVSFWLSDQFKESKHQKNIKNIINSNVEQLCSICNRLYVDVDEIAGNTGQDMEKAKQLSQYFNRNMVRLEMLRLNIENQLVLLKGDDNYTTQIKNILKDEDWIIEKCNRPDIPEHYKLSLWKENRDDLQKKTHDVIDIAKSLKIIT